MRVQKKMLIGLTVMMLTGLSIIAKQKEKFVVSLKETEQKWTINKRQHAVNTHDVKTISMRVGSDFTSEQFIACGPYMCNIQRGGDTGKTDLAMFNRESIEYYQTPPYRRPGELWVFQSTEPQWLHTNYPSSWDGMFNYSVSYLQDSQILPLIFANKLVNRPIKTTKNFAVRKGRREPNVLWYATDCALGNHAATGSARSMYVMELAEYLHIDVYAAKGDLCTKRLQSLITNQFPETEPRISNYTFYLAFESSLCKNYITKTFWKVLEAETYTIPVVLGGLSIEEYTKVAPPNSFIHVKNFTSPKALADHLKYVAENDGAFNYYLQWRNEFKIQKVGSSSGIECHYCKLAHERPEGRWDTFSKDFGSHNCLDVSAPSSFCSYYNLKCG